jgi:hypothetical protein
MSIRISFVVVREFPQFNPSTLQLDLLLPCCSQRLTLMQLDCGSSVYGQTELMPDVTLIRAGTLDNGGSDIEVKVEFFTKDRKSFVKPVEGAAQCQTMT